VFIFILLQCIIFVYGWEVFRPKNFIAIQKIYDKIIDYRISPHQLDFPAIKHNDQKIETIINTVNSFKPESTVVITEFGSPYVNPYENWSENFRTVSYYLPEYEVYELFWGNEKKYFKTQNYSLPQLIHSNKIILSSEKKYIVFLNTTEKTLLPNDNLLENTKPYIVNIETTEDFKYLGYKFIYKK